MTNSSGVKIAERWSKKLYKKQLEKIGSDVALRGIQWSEASVSHPLINRQWIDEMFAYDIPATKRTEGEVNVDIVTLKIPMLYKDIVVAFSIGDDLKYRFASGVVVTFLAREILGAPTGKIRRTFLPCFGLEIKPSHWDVKVPTFTRLYSEKEVHDEVMNPVELEVGIQTKNILWPIGTTFVLVNNSEYPKVQSKDL